jgi:hypothetical protein
MFTKTDTIGLYTKSLDGHREAYLNFLLNLFPSKRVNRIDALFSKQPILFMMIEESFFFYFLTAVMRAILGKRTVGLLFRPKPAAEGKSLRLRIKRLMLQFLKSISSIQTISIVPFNINPEFNNIADSWIYDFQLWDLEDSELDKFVKYQTDSLDKTINNPLNKSHPVITAIGKQDKNKGFDKFIKSATLNAGKAEYVFGGKVHESQKKLINKFVAIGGVCNDRLVSDDEILQLYSISSAVWCVYSSEYDQASGILGRAVQLDIPVIVRENSMMHKFCQIESISFICDKDLETQLVNNELKTTKFGVTRINPPTDKFRSHSLNQLNLSFHSNGSK